MHPEFRSLSTTNGLELVDPIETRRFTLLTSSPVTPTTVEASGFVFPVDAACRIHAEGFELPYTVSVTVRDLSGNHVASIDPPTTREFPSDRYLLELHAPLKIYLRVETGLRVVADERRVQFSFDETIPTTVGARSYHESPATTLTVPDDPEALMQAVSTFSSALKTTSPERSWPTLRGHPPRIRRGNELDIPSDLEAPDTGITITAPAEYGPIYAIAPLAYYLGAEVVPDDKAILKTETGVSYPLGEDVTDISDAVEDLFKRTFLMDCIVRTEGYYPVELHERTTLEPNVDVDFPALYDASIQERLSAYLSVPEDAFAEIEPSWHRVTYVRDEPDATELLPYVVNDMSFVRVKASDGQPKQKTETQRRMEEGVGSFWRRPATDFVRSSSDRERPVYRGNGQEANRDEDSETRGVPDLSGFVPLPDGDELEKAWVGDRTPTNGTKLLSSAFENDAPSPTDGVVEITVVCNDEAMREEWDKVAEVYRGRKDLRANVNCEFDVLREDLRQLLKAEHDMFHFIGHIDGRGFECSDGVLNAATIDTAGATTVLLNGCRSHNQGIELVEAGVNAAVVSLGDLWNSGAVEVGELLARLLHHGFNVGSAVEIVRKYASIGQDYVVVGDPGVTVAQCESITPVMYHVSETTGEETELAVEPFVYPTRNPGVGVQIRPHLSGIDEYHVAIGACGQTTISCDEFRGTLEGNATPLIVDGELVWSEVWFEGT